MENPTPDRLLVAALRRIDKDLSLVFLEPPGRWAVLHGQQLWARPDEQIDRTARELQREAAIRGHILDLCECQFAAAQALRDSQVVFYVTEEDGSYRAPDGRVVEKLLRMDFYRRNFGLKDWREMIQAKADVLRERRERSQGDIWETIRRDPAFKKVASHILWGTPVPRSIYVKETIDADHVVRRPAADGADAGACAGGDGLDGVPVRAPEQGAPAAGGGDGSG